MKIKLNRAAAALALPLVMSSLVACGGDSDAEAVEGPWEDVVAAAEDEGRISLYSVAPPPQNDRLVEAFNAEHPDIEVTVTRGAGELPGRVEAELKAGSGGADVFLYSDPQFFVTHADDLYDVEGPSVEGWRDDYWAEPGKAIIPTKYPWTTLIWNTDVFPEGFEDWPDMLEPRVKGKLAVYKEPTVSNCSTLGFMEESLGTDYLTELGQQQGKYYPSTVPMIQAIASGEVGVGMLGAPITIRDMQDQGAKVEFAYPSPGFALMWGGGALQSAKNPNAARVFLDFVMSEAGQEAINGDGLGTAGRDGVEGALEELDGWEMFDATECSKPETIQEAESKLNRYYP